MEKLKIFSASGEIALERDLADVKKPLMLLAGDEPQLVETVPQGADVIGALVRDEDGWTLASAKDDMPVSSGPKAGTDFHLTAGVACTLGPWVFRIEREGSDAGTVLLWRVGSSAIAADPLVQGRNQIASVKDGGYAVNPAVASAELCSIFPTSDGVEVLAPGSRSQRLSVPFAILFAVGPFQAMALPAADAAAAVKSGSPFSWPARRTRAGLLAMMLLVGLVSLAALALVKRCRAVEAELAARQGPEMVERHIDVENAATTDEDALVYQNSFYRSLPLILKAERSSITRDLIQRGRQISGHIGGSKAKENEKLVSSILAFLKALDDIQGAAQKGDWPTLKKTLEAADRKMFVRCDADTFYSDAKELVDFVTVILPNMFVSASDAGAAGFADVEKRIKAQFDDLADNIFMSGEIARRERDNAEVRWRALAEYIPARARFLSSPSGAGVDLRDAWAGLVDAFEADDASFKPMLKRERERIVEEILKRVDKADSVALINLSALGEMVGVENAQLSKWRARAAAARKEMSRKYRELYSDYRMRSAVAPGAPETLAVLDAMVKLGLEDNSFHQWALREKARVHGKKDGKDGNPGADAKSEDKPRDDAKKEGEAR